MTKIRSYSTTADGLKVTNWVAMPEEDVSEDYAPQCADAPAVKRVTATALVFDNDAGQRCFEMRATEQTMEAVAGMKALMEIIWGDKLKGVI